jgi:hypothetical protein
MPHRTAVVVPRPALPRGVHCEITNGRARYSAIGSDGREITWLVLPEGYNEPHAVLYLAGVLEREDPTYQLRLIADDAGDATARSSHDALALAYERPTISAVRLLRPQSAETPRSLQACRSS